MNPYSSAGFTAPSACKRNDLGAIVRETHLHSKDCSHYFCVKNSPTVLIVLSLNPGPSRWHMCPAFGNVFKERHCRYVVGGVELPIVDERWRIDLM